MLASSYWDHLIEYLKGEPVTGNHKLCISLSYQLPKCTVDVALPLLLQLLLILCLSQGVALEFLFASCFITSSVLCSHQQIFSGNGSKDFWKRKKKVFCHMSMCFKESSDQEKKRKLRVKKRFIHSCLCADIWDWCCRVLHETSYSQGRYNFMQVYLDLKHTNKQTKTNTPAFECMMLCMLLSCFQITLPCRAYSKMWQLAQELAQMALHQEPPSLE